MATPLAAGSGAAIIPDGTPATVAPSVGPAQARSDAHLLELWLFGKRPHTRRAYLRVAGAFLAALGLGGLRAATLGDLQAWAGAHLAEATLGHASVATTSKYLHARPDDSSAMHLGL